MNLRHQIQHIALRWPAYGYRRVQAELVRQGWPVNHQRILRLLRTDNLLCVRRRRFILTTDSRHGLPIYPNLVEGMVLSSIDQLWVADITDIRSQMEFVYLAVLLDAFSRRCIGWALQRTLDAALARQLCAWRSGDEDPSLVWCIIPTVADNMLPAITPPNSRNTASASAGAAPLRPTTMPRPKAS